MSSEDDIQETGEVDAGGANGAGLPLGAGPTLRAAREQLRLTIDLVASETRIPKRHLESIEAGDFADLPSRTYAIGFARSYARAVKLDEAMVAGLVRDEMGAAGPRYSSVGQGMEPGDPAKLPSRGLALFGAVAALILALGITAFASTYYGAGLGPGSLLSDEDAQPGDDLSAMQIATPSEPVAEEIVPGPDSEVVFTALNESGWVRFYEDGGDVLFEGVMEEGDTFVVPADADDPWINTGRASQYKITIAGQVVPTLSDELIQLQAPISAAALLERDEG